MAALKHPSAPILAPGAIFFTFSHRTPELVKGRLDLDNRLPSLFLFRCTYKNKQMGLVTIMVSLIFWERVSIEVAPKESGSTVRCSRMVFFVYKKSVR
jgi:hypothetical protein